MSILHSRIIQHGGMGTIGVHPAVTPATPMIMPIVRVTYYDGVGYYEDLFPSPPATADPNHVPLASSPAGTWGKVVAAGVV